MITLAMYTMNFAHPGLLLGRIRGLPGLGGSRSDSEQNLSSGVKVMKV